MLADSNGTTIPVHRLSPWLAGYAILSVLHLLAEYCGWTSIIIATKPLLVTLLAIWLFRAAYPWSQSAVRWLWVGLLFSVGGDTLLLGAEHGARPGLYFLLGLGSFLIAQLCYAIAFWQLRPSASAGLFRRRPVWVLAYLIYLAGMLWLLWPGIPSDMRLPVTVYAIAIVGMALSATHLYGVVPNRLFWGLLTGVLLFLLSDSLIALNKFWQPLAFARMGIMSTYLLAQGLIVGYGCRLVRWRMDSQADTHNISSNN